MGADVVGGPEVDGPGRVTGDDEKQQDRQHGSFSGPRRKVAVARHEGVDHREEAPQPQRHDGDERCPGELRVQESGRQDGGAFP